MKEMKEMKDTKKDFDRVVEEVCRRLPTPKAKRSLIESMTRNQMDAMAYEMAVAALESLTQPIIEGGGPSVVVQNEGASVALLKIAFFSVIELLGEEK